MVKTRSSKKQVTRQPAAAAAAGKKHVAPGCPPPAADPNPPKLFVLRQDVSPHARIVSLPNPATARESRYLYCPNTGLYEITRVAAPISAMGTWLLAPQRREPCPIAAEQAAVSTRPLEGGYSIKTPDLFIATPIDLLFIVLPALVPKSPGGEKQMFLAADDYLDSLERSAVHLHALLRNTELRARIKERMTAACDTVDAGGETMFRFSATKLATELLAAARRMADRGLPPSMEEAFVRKPLQRPVVDIKREQTPVSLAPANGEETRKQLLGVPEGIPHLLRMRVAIKYISSSYLSRNARAFLEPIWSSNALIDYVPLDEHLAHLAELRSQAQTLRSLSDNITRKRGLDCDDAAEMRAEKKSKKDLEETRKKKQSRGVKQLAKADTSGMKKLSSFFSQAPVKQ